MRIEHLQAEESASQMLMGVPVTDCPKQQIEREGEQYPRHRLTNTKVDPEG